MLRQSRQPRLLTQLALTTLILILILRQNRLIAAPSRIIRYAQRMLEPTALLPASRPHSSKPNRLKARSSRFVVLMQWIAATCAALVVRGDNAEDGAGPALEQREDHGRVAD